MPECQDTLNRPLLLTGLMGSGKSSVGRVLAAGGAVIAEQNRQLMRRRGVVVNLTATLEQILSRLQGYSDRPLLVGERAPERARALIEGREQFYADADIRIDTDGKSVEDVAAEILCRLKGFSSECTDR